ncbi:hypothetical protein DFS34DRAFT_369501 [Phlyctochytrium arcticum]|nr:hypothetical protein DFS34DRAFT_369501 [Phlyctochytrium arcticum]
MGHILYCLAGRHVGGGCPATPIQYAGALIQVYLDEDDLLQAMLSNPLITCHCLDVENPISARYNERNLADKLFPVDLCKKSRAYKTDCAKCNTEQPPTGPKFPMCSKCRRVRYCSRDCQKADWGSHKTTCGRKRSSWWAFVLWWLSEHFCSLPSRFSLFSVFICPCQKLLKTSRTKLAIYRLSPSLSGDCPLTSYMLTF